MKSIKTVAIILAAGKSERFGSNKLQEKLSGEPVWLASYNKFHLHPEVDAVGIVTSQEMLSECWALAADCLFVVEGGADRTESSRKGFENLPNSAEIVLFHDAARPFVSSSLISRIIEGIRIHGAAFPAIQVTDTVKSRENGAFKTLDRSQLVTVQTPQGALVDHFRKAFNNQGSATDDMALLESVGVSTRAVEGESSNRKITVRSDVAKSDQRTGIGYDVHRFSSDPARPLWLGGVLFENESPGLEGHSDADALIHSVVDALLGAVGKGDIGDRYPNSDPQWKNAPSILFLKECAKELGEEGWNIVNIDVSVLAERPKISQVKDLMRQRIADAVGISPDRVGVKATTNEGLGSIGRGEGIASFAVATVERSF